MMKLNYKNGTIAMVLASFSAFVTACGSGSSPTTATPASPASVQQTPTVKNTAAVNSCIPLTGTLGFSGSLYTDNFQSIYAGTIPSIDPMVPGGGQFGQLKVSADGTFTPSSNARLVQTTPLPHPDGTFAMNVMSTADPNGGLAIATDGTGNGVITISPYKLSVIYALYDLNYNTETGAVTPLKSPISYAGFPNPGMHFDAPGMTPAQLEAQAPCVSGIAVSMSFASYVNNFVNGGRVYLYLNNTEHGDYLQF